VVKWTHSGADHITDDDVEANILTVFQLYDNVARNLSTKFNGMSIVSVLYQLRRKTSVKPCVFQVLKKLS